MMLLLISTRKLSANEPDTAGPVPTRADFFLESDLQALKAALTCVWGIINAETAEDAAHVGIARRDRALVSSS